MKLPIFQVDAFASETFKGNPAAVIPLKEWLPDKTMQKIAMENNLSETAFFVPTKAGFEIRWFTPLAEVDLCGHATLATAHVIFNEAGFNKDTLEFGSRSGKLSVRKVGDKLQLNFPSDMVSKVELPEFVLKGIGGKPLETYMGKTDYLLFFESEEEVKNLAPNHYMLQESGARGVIATAKGSEVDFISRFFAPGVGIDEDPVTGSAHTTLTPFWSQKLEKKEMKALQVSSRGGELDLTLEDDRVLIAGKAITYLRGEIFI
ncbi:PhzF family phenazine biosynthesis protein [Sunxiuqinia sp. A32]|uniref:PhzF family phenazine biosynthesis protein n=1 Tax=Sunxiuqinia sp. A32 TaxID=3461496 RepID=UPI0040458476